MKYKISSLLPYMGLFFCSYVHAGGMGTETQNMGWKPMIGIGGGVGITGNLGRQQSFPSQNPLTDESYTYSPSNRVQTQGLFEIFLGAEHAIYQNWFTQAGIAYNQAGTYHEKGTFVQGMDPGSSNQYTYNYRVVARELLAQAKFMYAYRDKFYPYFLLGLGGSFNEASRFSTNVPSYLTFTRGYASHTAGSFAYKIGAGADVDVMNHVRVGVAYRISAFGSVSLGQAQINAIPVSGTLSQSNLYINEVLAQLTYVI